MSDDGLVIIFCFLIFVVIKKYVRSNRLFCHILVKPPTEKVHLIIARTSMFVSKHGGQSEIILRVKQGDNPMFQFLMPDHHLHAYFRFLVEHQELLEEEKKTDTVNDQTVSAGGIGALSLLGSVYGLGEDEDDANECTLESKTNEFNKSVNLNISHESMKDAAPSKPTLPLKEKAPAVKKVASISTVGTMSRVKKESDVLDKLDASDPWSATKVEKPVLEPPCDIKRVVDKIVEFILKNGKEFEAVLIEQDSKHGRFRFLLPSNQYHPYYLEVLQKAQKLKLSCKGSGSVKTDFMGHGVDKKTAVSKESNLQQSNSVDLPYDSDRKEKFKMTLSKSKRDGQDPVAKSSKPQIEVNIDAAAAAVILQAATRGVKNPTLGISARSLNISQGPGSDGEQASSFGSFPSQHQNSIQKLDQNGEQSLSVPVAKAIAKTASIAAESDADSSEVGLTKEQKLKFERLKRAKMFAAMIKGGAAPSRIEAPVVAVEQLESFSLSNMEVNLEKEGSEGRSVAFGADANYRNKTALKNSADDNLRRSLRTYRSKSKHNEGEEDENMDTELKREKELGKERDQRHTMKRRGSHHYKGDEEDKEKRDHKHSRKKRRSHPSGIRGEEDPREEEQEEREKRVHKHSRKKVRSHHSSHHGRDRYKHQSDAVSQHCKKHDSSSDEEHYRSSHRRRRHRSRSSGDEHWRPRHHRNLDSSSEDDWKHNRDHDSSDEHKHKYSKQKISESTPKEELEEGEICAKSDQSKAGEDDLGNREASVDMSIPYHRTPSQPPMEVSDDLKAKIRAMLLATL